MPGTVGFFKLFLSFHRLVGLYHFSEPVALVTVPEHAELVLWPQVAPLAILDEEVGRGLHL